MSTKFWQRIFSFVVLAGLLLSLARPNSARAMPTQQKTASTKQASPAAQKAGTPGVGAAIVVKPLKADVSSALRSISAKPEQPSAAREIPSFTLPKAQNGVSDQKTVAPDKAYAPNMPVPLQSFAGVGNIFGGWPPDTEGDIGPNHYVQWINLDFAIWQIDKVLNTATLIYGPVAGNTLWSGFGGACENTNNGDPIALYDSLADRWLMSQFALPNFPSGPFYQCIAISTTGDPTGAWYRYAYQIPVNKMNDYPKFGVWPDAYYFTDNQFNAGSETWGGAGVGAFERQKMLIGDPTAQLVYFDTGAVTLNYGGMLPADLDGPPFGQVPPANAPGLFSEWDDSTWLGDPADTIRVWEFHVDWTTPSNSTFGANASYDANYFIPTVNVDPNMCGGARNCIPQPGTSAKLDAIADRLMYRLQYRNFGGYQTLVTNHTVDATGTDIAGVHWWELRNTGSGWGMYQQGVYSPDSDNRWMASAALDHSGDLAVGYSVSSSTTYPSVRYAGRLVGDPLGTLAQGEASLVAGGGSQTDMNYSRWGDYSMMAVDPSDDCTFWYTQEYYQTTSLSGWVTRIGSFKFPSCSIGPTGTLSGTVTSSSAGNPPIANAQVTAGPYGTTTAGDGTYSMIIPTGSYTVTASAFGFVPETFTNVAVNADETTVQPFVLNPAASGLVQGHVTDANTGWPLYASITIDGVSGTLWTNPLTGYYSVTLPNGDYTFHVTAFYPGYLPDDAAVTVAGPTTQDFALDPDLTICNAPGYAFGSGYPQNFDAATPPTLPGDWGKVSLSGSGDWFTNAGTNYPSGYAAHSAPNLVYFNSFSTLTGAQARLYSLSGFDMTAFSSQQLTFWMFRDTGYSSDNDNVQVQVSITGGTTWVNVGPAFPRYSAGGNFWEMESVDLSAYSGATNLMLGFLGTSAFGNDVHLDDIQLGGTPECVAGNGGLVVGNVYDGNTALALTGATVASDEGGSFTTIATPLDPAVADGFYYMFAHTGDHAFTASMTGYQPDMETVSVPHYGAVGQDFNLGAGFLTYDPNAFDVSLIIGTAETQTLTLNNEGSAAVSFQFKELNKGMQPLGSFGTPTIGIEPVEWNEPDTAGFKDNPPLPAAPPYAAGDVIQTWNTSLTGVWGLGYNHSAGDLWIGTIGAAGGDDLDHRFLTDGTNTGNTINTAPWMGVFAADMAYNVNTGKLWQLDVGGANCLHEMDPVSLTTTGNVICPAFASSERGLAYDPSTDTFYAGGWNDHMIYHFAADGTMLNSANVGLPIAGLAYNPDTQHLFVMTNASPNPVYVLDAANNFAVLGQFNIAGFTDYGGAGFEMDCSGHLWAVDQASSLAYEVDSGETTSMCATDVPWLSEKPTSGTIAPAGIPLAPKPAVTGGDPSRKPVTVDRSLYTTGVQQPQVAVMDSSFEAGTPNPYWEEYSFTFGTPLCDPAFCGTGGGTAGPHSGDWWAWFGGSLSGDVGILTQTVIIPTSASFLNLYYWIGDAAASPTDNFRVLVDGNVLFTTPVTSITDGYQELNLDITAYANGLPHVIRLDSVTTGSGNISVDDVTVQGSGLQPIAVGFNAGAVDQPGVYHAQLKIVNDTPYNVPNIPITLTVTAPTWGKLNGTVTGLGYCDSDPAPLKNATVVITGASQVYTVTTDKNGYYQWWFPAAQSPVSVNVTADGHTPGSATGVVVTATQTTTQNFDLRWLQPCVTAAPKGIEVTVVAGYSTTQQLALNNNGAFGTDFSISEKDRGVIPPVIPPSNGVFERGTAAPSNGPAPVKGIGAPAVSIKLPAGNTAYAVEAANSYFTAFDLDVPAVLPNISGFTSVDFPGAGTYSNGSVYVLDIQNNLYQLDPATGAVLSTITVTAPPNGETWTGLAVDPTSGQVYGDSCNISTSSLFSIDLDSGVATRIGAITNAPCAIDLAIDGSGQGWTYDLVNDMFLSVDLATGAGTVIGSLGFDSNFGQGMAWDPATDQIYLAAFNNVAFQAELRIADRTTGNTTLVGVLGSSVPGGTCQLPFLGIPVTTGFVDKVPWVSEDPITGTLAADSSQNIAITFDAGVPDVIYYGSYMATLSVKTKDPVNPTVGIPVTMTVVAPTYGVTLTPVYDALSALPGATVTYTLHVVNTGNVPNTFTLGASGNAWTTQLPVTTTAALGPGASTDVKALVTIPADAVVGSSDDVNITITGAGGANAFTALTTTAGGSFGVNLEPETSAATGKPGSVITYTLHLTNTGTVTDTFQVSVSGVGAAWTTLPKASFTLGAGASVDVLVVVTIPAGAANGDYPITVTATSMGDPTKTDDVAITTTVFLYHIYLPVVLSNAP